MAKRKRITLWIGLAVMVWSIGRVGIDVTPANEIRATPIAQAHRSVQPISPIFGEKLAAAVNGLDGQGWLYAGLTRSATTSVPAVSPLPSFTTNCMGSFCGGSLCAQSLCGLSQCTHSQCSESGCLGSFCTSSGCTESNCLNSICLTTTCASCP